MLQKHGDRDGAYWVPAMADTPLRGANGRHEWFWEPDDEGNILSVEALVDKYEKSVGRNATLILGLTPDPEGLIPEGDAERLREFGDEIRRRFGNPLATAADSAREITLRLDKPSRVNYCMIQEDISRGERIRRYRIDAECGGQWITVAHGESVGHKRIQPLRAVEATALRLVVEESRGEPLVKVFSAFNVEE